ncbi:hypothetical protein ACTA71_011658 [Dictyostelium dimigraforme]
MLFIYLIVTFLTEMETIAKIKAFFILLLSITNQPFTFKMKIAQCNDLIVNVPYNECYPIYGDCVYNSVLISQSPNSIKYQINLYSNINCDEENMEKTSIPFKESGLNVTNPLNFYIIFFLIVTVLLVMIL